MPDFLHAQSAHCESGVAANLLRHQGIAISEAMAFGIGGGLFFGYLPFFRLNGLPLITYRSAAGHILKRIGRIPGITLQQQKFRDKTRAMDALDAALERSIPVGLQTGVYWLSYFPSSLRFHFNAHNLVVYGKEGDDYLISDPVFPEPVRCPSGDLARARFASGALAPHGKMYYLSQVPKDLDRASLVVAGVRSVCKMMLGMPFPLIGIKGIRFLADRLEQWPARLGRRSADLHIGHVVRMQEEIGTGGGGFRFMYAAFLQESGGIMQDQSLSDCASILTRAGDCWREFALIAARICKNRGRPEDTYSLMAATIRRSAELEEKVFRQLDDWVKKQS